MIAPTRADIGRGVVYRSRPGAEPEQGEITSFNDHVVFIRYQGDAHAKGTPRRCLEWMSPSPTPDGAYAGHDAGRS